jgi:hypothetical protein
MHSGDDWPRLIRAYRRRTHDGRLGGMSLGQVRCVRFPDGSVIVKTSSRPSEALFYKAVARRLPQVDIPIPETQWSYHLPDSPWLLLEDLPDQLPVLALDRWRARRKPLQI